MNRNQKIFVVLPAAIAVFSISLIIFLPHDHAVAEPMTMPKGPQCETTYTVIYSDPTKFNEEKTISSLKQSLSGVDFSADILDGHPWYDYMQVGKPDSKSTSEITIPTVSGTVDKIVTKTMQGMDGVSKVDSMITTWCS